MTGCAGLLSVGATSPSGAVLFIYILAAAWIFTLVFNGRAAFLHTGAMIATWMSASVFFVIIPNQKKVVATLLAGETPDPALGKQAKQRSTHNNYLTLPVIFLMLSNHYPLAWSSRYAVGIVGLVVVAGAAVRHFFNVAARRQGVALVDMDHGRGLYRRGDLSLHRRETRRGDLAIAPESGSRIGSMPPTDEAALALQSRCSMCHAAEPVWDGIPIAPKGIRLETPEDIARHAEAIRVQAVLTHAMPPNNITEMTLDERRAVASWLAARDQAIR